MRDDIDTEKLAEISLALISLTVHGHKSDPRVWKGIDWEVLDMLYEKGWISDPKTKAKSVALSDEGMTLCEEFVLKHFGKA